MKTFEESPAGAANGEPRGARYLRPAPSALPIADS
jgi:hypothetical protein